MADEQDDKDLPDFRQSWPRFLDPDMDPSVALARFYDFAWKLLLSYPPSIFRRRFSPTEQEDLIERVIEKCCKNDLRNLRKYRNQGRPFSLWLYKVAVNEAISCLRTREAENRRGRLMMVPEMVRPDQNLKKCQVLEAVRECLDLLSENQRNVLIKTAEGYKPRHIAEKMGLGPQDGKTISEQLRQARKLLRKALKQKGIDLGFLDA